MKQLEKIVIALSLLAVTSCSVIEKIKDCNTNYVGQEYKDCLMRESYLRFEYKR